MDLFKTISNNRLWNKHGTPVVWLLACLILLIAVSRVAWIGYSQSKIKNANYLAQNIDPLVKSSKLLYRVNDIVSANLFGDPAPKIVVENAPKTTLDLTLQGILWATDSTQARAIIKSSKRSSELYSVGEDIKGAGASVKEIRDGEVLLDRNGATESLPLLKKTSSGNQPLISYLDQTAAIELGGNTRTLNRNVSKPVSRAASNATSRKVRKPNFSGLDKALRKMGEI
ncbi:MAG: type II secretory pathway component PulC [Arenicella sp.]|jgi:type II secretory pathway component PulC